MLITRNLISICSIILLICPTVFSQHYYPGYLWGDRAFAYADEFWDTYNSEYYNFYPSDCANFVSQIVQAGCDGLCELNNTNWPGWDGTWTTCWSYRNTQPSDEHCVMSGSHYTIINCDYMDSWFQDAHIEWPYCDWPDWDDAYSTDEIPNWVSNGCVGIACNETPSGDLDFWHSVYIGSGSGPDAKYWAHTTDRQNYPISYLMNDPFTDFIAFYGPLSVSPIIVKVKNSGEKNENE